MLFTFQHSSLCTCPLVLTKMIASALNKYQNGKGGKINIRCHIVFLMEVIFKNVVIFWKLKFSESLFRKNLQLCSHDKINDVEKFCIQKFLTIYHIAQNSGGGKLWWIGNFKNLAGKTLANCNESSLFSLIKMHHSHAKSYWHRLYWVIGL